VDDRVLERCLVERREVPEVEVKQPERERDERMGQDPQARDHPVAQQRRQHRAGQAQGDAQGAEVAEQDVAPAPERTRNGVLVPPRLATRGLGMS
jgi:hypothetical protein